MAGEHQMVVAHVDKGRACPGRARPKSWNTLGWACCDTWQMMASVSTSSRPHAYMAGAMGLLHRQTGVEQQDAALRPLSQVASRLRERRWRSQVLHLP